MIERVCRVSGEKFLIDKKDLEFYAKMGVISNEQLGLLLSKLNQQGGVVAAEKISADLLIGLPTLCPDERYRRRLSWRNERSLYKRKCDATEKIIVSIHNELALYPVYERSYWWSDKWSALDYAQDFDFSVSFFQQFKSLLEKVPQVLLQNDNGTKSINSQYCQDFAAGKNCYFVFESGNIEDSMFCNHSNGSTEIFECYNVSDSELSYESIASSNLYNCKFLVNSKNCFDCVFGLDLIGCKNCFGCVNLRNKEYYFLNEKCTKEQYEQKIKNIELGNVEKLNHYRKNFTQFCRKIPQRYSNIRSCENCVGNDIFNSKNCLGFGVFNSEDCRYVQNNDMQKNCYDCQGWKSSWCMESITCDESWMTAYSLWSMNCKNVFYSDSCHNCEYCFGCVGLRHKKYCILNKQYTKEEYESLVPKIMAHMKKTGEWGEFFPISLSPFAYNETVANEYYPLTKTEAEAKGFKWKDDEQSVQYTGPKYEVPENIKDVSDDIVTKVLQCERSGKFYRIQKAELKFYRKMNVPIPRLHPDERHKDRMALRNPRKLWTRSCADCGCQLQTTFAPDRPETVLCEACYLKVVD